MSRNEWIFAIKWEVKKLFARCGLNILIVAYSESCVNVNDDVVFDICGVNEWDTIVYVW